MRAKNTKKKRENIKCDVWYLHHFVIQTKRIIIL